jgi:hypothetical protein
MFQASRRILNYGKMNFYQHMFVSLYTSQTMHGLNHLVLSTKYQSSLSLSIPASRYIQCYSRHTDLIGERIGHFFDYVMFYTYIPSKIK